MNSIQEAVQIHWRQGHELRNRVFESALPGIDGCCSRWRGDGTSHGSLESTVLRGVSKCLHTSEPSEVRTVAAREAPGMTAAAA